jgi:uncharacterized membrane protein YdjX (TVP38/TMEM64 family)
MHSTSTTAARPQGGLLRIALVLVLLAGVALAARSVPVERPLAWLTQEVQALGVWGPLAFAALYVAVTVCLLPGTPVVLAAGAVFGTALGTGTIMAASTASAALSFCLSRYVAHDWFAGHVRHYPLIDRVWRALGRPGGWKVVAAVRLSHALPFGAQNLLFGLSPVRFVPFLAATVVAMLPGTLLYTYLGDLGARALGAGEDAPAGPGGWVLRLGTLAVIALAVLYVGRFARRVLRDEADEGPAR